MIERPGNSCLVWVTRRRPTALFFGRSGDQRTLQPMPVSSTAGMLCGPGGSVPGPLGDPGGTSAVESLHEPASPRPLSRSR